MHLAGEHSQHSLSISSIHRFTENCFVDHNNRIRAEHKILRTNTPHRERFLARQPLRTIARRFSGTRCLIDVRRLHDELDASLAEKSLASRRGGGQNERWFCGQRHELAVPYRAAHRFDELCRIVSDAIFENDFDIFDVVNIL